MSLQVTVKLIKGGVGEPEVIASMTLINDLEDSIETGGRRGSYRWRLFGKRGYFMKSGRIRNWPRNSKHVWALVARCLKEAGYS